MTKVVCRIPLTAAAVEWSGLAGQALTCSVARSVAAVLTLLGGASLCPAQLATYDFSGLVGITSGSVSGSNGSGASGSLTVGGLGRGGGLSAASSNAGYNSSSFTLTTGTSGLTAAITANDYYTFSLTPTSDGTFDFTNTSLTFGSRVSNIGNSPTLSLLTSRSGFTAAAVVDSVAVSSTSATAYTLNLNSIGTFTTTAGTALEFRLYGYGLNAGSTTLRLENATAGGLNVGGLFTPVPEPATLLAVAAAGLGLARLRRLG